MRRSLVFIILTSAQLRILGGPGDEFWQPMPGVFESNAVIRSMVLFQGSLYVAGAFNSVAGISATNVARWNGTNWFAFGGGVPGRVETVAVSEEAVYVGGSFGEAMGAPALNVAKWDGIKWSGLEAGLNDTVFGLVVKGLDLYAGGRFTMSGNIPLNRIARWNGTSWMPLGSGIHHESAVPFVLALATNLTELYVGGNFTSAGSKFATNIARWDGNEWLPLGAGLGNGVVTSISYAENGLVAGGSFRQSGDLMVPNIAMWDGNYWCPIGGGVTRVFSHSGGVLAIARNGKDIFIGGVEIMEVGGVVATNIAKWDGCHWSSLGSGIRSRFGGTVNALATTGSDLFVGGFIDLAGDLPTAHLALWHIPHSLSINQAGVQVEVRWPATGTNFLLESKNDLNGADWSEVMQPPEVHNEECVVTESTNVTNRFYRLRRKLWE